MIGNFSPLTEFCTSGRSGSFFYYSEDEKFMLKTISEDEFKFFRGILKDYYDHLMKNDNTLITKYELVLQKY